MRAGYILIGGKSSRFGRDKALFDFQGRPMALVGAERVGQVVDQVTLVGDPQQYSRLGLRVIPDRISDAGPLAGIAAALEDSSAPHTLVVGCDMPFLRTALLERLLALAAESKAQALVPLGNDGRPQPLCSVYAASAAGTVCSALAAGVRKITDALDQLETVYLDPADYADVDPTGESFRNINTPADL